MPHKDRWLIVTIMKNAATLFRRQLTAGQIGWQTIGLKDHITIGFRIIRPKLGSKEVADITIRAGNGDPVGERHICAPQQSVHHLASKAAFDGGGMQEILINQRSLIALLVGLDQLTVPTGMHNPEVVKFQKERQGIKPVQEVVPLGRIVPELFQGFLDYPVMSGIVLAQERTSSARSGAGTVPKGVVFLIAHYHLGRAVLHHVTNDMQYLTDSMTTVKNIADKDSLPIGMTINTLDQLVVHLFQQAAQG